MKAMILAAGFGKRLTPLTLHTPKALIKVQKKPALKWVIEAIECLQPDLLVVNAHHMAADVAKYLKIIPTSFKKLSIIEEKILGTGKGIANAAHLLKYSNTVIHNVDIMSDYDLSELKKLKFKPKTLAYLLYSKKIEPKGILLDNKDRLVDFFDDTLPVKLKDKILISRSGRLKHQNPAYKKCSFCGIHLVGKNFWQFIDSMLEVPTSILDVYRLGLENDFEIIGHNIGDANILDIGSLENLKYANSRDFFLQNSKIND